MKEKYALSSKKKQFLHTTYVSVCINFTKHMQLKTVNSIFQLIEKDYFRKFQTKTKLMQHLYS